MSADALTRRHQPASLRAAQCLDVVSALALIDGWHAVRECEVDAAGLVRLHELAAAGEVHLDWGAGGWQFFQPPGEPARDALPAD